MIGINIWGLNIKKGDKNSVDCVIQNIKQRNTRYFYRNAPFYEWDTTFENRENIYNKTINTKDVYNREIKTDISYNGYHLFEFPKVGDIYKCTVTDDNIELMDVSREKGGYLVFAIFFNVFSIFLLPPIGTFIDYLREKYKKPLETRLWT